VGADSAKSGPHPRRRQREEIGGHRRIHQSSRGEDLMTQSRLAADGVKIKFVPQRTAARCCQDDARSAFKTEKESIANG
jgi:hypothetical protein